MGITTFRDIIGSAWTAINGSSEPEEKSELDKLPDTIAEVERQTNAALQEDKVEASYRVFSFGEEKQIIQIDGDLESHNTHHQVDNFLHTISATITPSDVEEGGYVVSMSTSDDPVNKTQGVTNFYEAIHAIIGAHREMLPGDMQDKIKESTSREKLQSDGPAVGAEAIEL